MAARFQFESPGASFTEEMTKMLTQRKADERQQLLDSLAQNADARAQQQLENEKAFQDKQMAGMQQTQDITRLNELSKGMRMGDVVESRGYSPEDVELMQRYGRIQDIAPTPAADGSVRVPDTNTPVQHRFVGDEKERERERIRKEQGTVLTAMLTDPKRKQAGETLAAIASMNDGVIPPDAFKLMMPDAPLWMFDEQNGTFHKVADMPANGQIIQKGYPPRELQGRQFMQVGNSRTTGNVLLYDVDKGVTVEIPNSARTDTTQDASLGVPQGLMESHQNNAALVTPSSANWLGMGGGKYKPEDLRGFRMSASQIIGSARVSRDVKRLTQILVNNPAQFKAILAKTPLDEKDMQDFEILRDMVVPPGLIPVLQANPDVPAVKEINPKSVPPPARPQATHGGSGQAPIKPVPSHQTLESLLINRKP